MESNESNPRSLSIAHDFLIQMGGAENVVEVMAEEWKEAPIFTSATFGEDLYPVFQSPRVNNTWMQNLPGMRKHHKKLFFLYPFAFRSLKMARNTVAWISASSFAKWIPKPKGATFVCYCHTPPRYFWNPDEYLKNEIHSKPLRKLVRMMMPLFRWSDRRQAQKVDLFLANSRNVKERIFQCYGKDCEVVYPPVDVERFQVSDRSEDFFLIVSRLVAYKRIDIAVEAFSRAGKKLIVIGDGPDRARLESIAGDCVTFLGRAPNEVVTEKMSTCQGFVFPGSEDFGITPVEAQACGKPIIAFREGGALETVVEGRTGVFFDFPDADSILGALRKFDETTWNTKVIRRNAERFSTERFLQETREILSRYGVLEAFSPETKQGLVVGSTGLDARADRVGWTAGVSGVEG